MRLGLLDAAVSEDRGQWRDLLERWPAREVLSEPAYLELFASAGERCVALHLDAGTSHVLLPLILRPLSALSWSEDRQGWDATSAYGYGGPFAWGDLDAARRAFWPAFEDWARQEHVVSCFSRLSLFDDELAMPDHDVFEIQNNVVRSLALDDAAMWMDYAHKVRKNVQRAERDGVRIELDLTGDRLDAFCEIYAATMQRREASAGYFFGSDFFRRIVDTLPGQFAFFHALLEQQVVSSELVLVSATHVYSFLGGTLESAFAHRPNDLLKHRVIQWAREKGKQAYVLGGGYGGDDGIFAYKRSFAPRGVTPFKVLRKVLDDPSYQQLIARRRQAEEKAGKPWSPRDGYFPAYRS